MERRPWWILVAALGPLAQSSPLATRKEEPADKGQREEEDENFFFFLRNNGGEDERSAKSVFEAFKDFFWGET